MELAWLVYGYETVAKLINLFSVIAGLVVAVYLFMLFYYNVERLDKKLSKLLSHWKKVAFFSLGILIISISYPNKQLVGVMFGAYVGQNIYLDNAELINNIPTKALESLSEYLKKVE